MRFRRRRRGGLWFQTAQLSETNDLGVPSDGVDAAQDAFPIIANNLDAPANAATLGGGTTASLPLTEFPGYKVLRIVGKLHVTMQQDPSVTEPPAPNCIVKAGFFVDRVTATGALSTDTLAAWNPFSETAAQKRWLWRRSWCLSNQRSGLAGGNFASWPPSNSFYGSVSDGPNVDFKPKVLVGYEERLFLQIAAIAINPGTGPDLRDFGISWNTDLRMFAIPIRNARR